jgi:hypothetical protein
MPLPELSPDRSLVKFQREEHEQDPSPPWLESHSVAVARFLVQREVVLMTDAKPSKNTRRQTRKVWKNLEKQYGRETVAVMKRLTKHGGDSFGHFGTVETRLSV